MKVETIIFMNRTQIPELWGNYKRYNMHIMAISGGKEREKSREIF